MLLWAFGLEAHNDIVSFWFGGYTPNFKLPWSMLHLIVIEQVHTRLQEKNQTIFWG